MKKTSAWVAGSLLCLTSLLGNAQTKTLWEEYERLIDSRGMVGALGPLLPGDQVNNACSDQSEFQQGTL